jgi:hypothetical protein
MPFFLSDIFSFIFQREPEDETKRPDTSKTIRCMGSSAAESSPREIQWKKETFVDKAGDNPDEEWSVGGNFGHHLVVLNSILRVTSGPHC